ncbi:MAG: Peptidyl-prolyl cis-trans isomerase (EC [uncultured Paraburkholderia sp.]|nr:MAG: Peptidyl-prolyl cis-trans isomerase (EC [uncultured Paraburkholderia sp.]CAH2941733.1 MAG: Peptidyl-prolyl cis-trans isomerase (EC [uncultured Paraburkholderia sp.]
MKHRPIAVTVRQAALLAVLATVGLAGSVPLAQAANKPSSKPSAEKIASKRQRVRCLQTRLRA